MMYKLVEVNVDHINEGRFNKFETKTIYTTKEWLRFIIRTQSNVKICVLEIYENDRFLGYFTGAIVTLAKSFCILGSPFNGWNTMSMGFDLYDSSEAIKLIPHVVRYFQENHYCLYSQISNLYFDKDELLICNMRVQSSVGYQTDLTLPEQELYSRLSKGTKANIKKFERMDCRVEEDYSQEFVDLYWNQLVETFGKQGLAPSYDKKRIEVMIDELSENGMILCIKAVTPEGICPATLIQIGYGYLSITVGCPSFLKYQKDFRPNEALMWYAIKHWKHKGAALFDYGGGGEYKKKYGGNPIEYNTVSFSRIPGLFALKEIAKTAYWKLNSLKARIKTQ